MIIPSSFLLRRSTEIVCAKQASSGAKAKRAATKSDTNGPTLPLASMLEPLMMKIITPATIARTSPTMIRPIRAPSSPGILSVSTVVEEIDIVETSLVRQRLECVRGPTCFQPPETNHFERGVSDLHLSAQKDRKRCDARHSRCSLSVRAAEGVRPPSIVDEYSRALTCRGEGDSRSTPDGQGQERRADEPRRRREHRRLRRGGEKGSRAGPVRPRAADLCPRRLHEPAADLGPRPIAAGEDVPGRLRPWRARCATRLFPWAERMPRVQFRLRRAGAQGADEPHRRARRIDADPQGARPRAR